MSELREQAERAGQGLDVEALISARMEQVARAENAEAAIARVRDVCDRIWDVVHVGCRCFTDECTGTCGAGKPLAWNLDPADVLLAIKGDGDE